MRINFSAPIANLDGSPVMEGDRPMTLGNLAINALVATLQGPDGQPEHLDGIGKVRNALLAETIFKASEPLDLKAEDIALLKERIGRAYSPLAVMRAWALLDGDAHV